MATAVGIMDERNLTSRTDVLVVANPASARLTWVPRDLWCESIGDRVNQAFNQGGHAALREALAEHGVPIEHSLCLNRAATERVAERLDLMMPIARRIELRVPEEPGGLIRERSRTVVMEPPATRLRGVAIHDWISARYADIPRESGDLARIRRQQQFLAVLLGDGTDLSAALDDRSQVALSSEEALADLRTVRADWTFGTLGPLTPRRIDGMEVLVRGRGSGHPLA